jgi:hypothetical protein
LNHLLKAQVSGCVSLGYISQSEQVGQLVVTYA